MISTTVTKDRSSAVRKAQFRQFARGARVNSVEIARAAKYHLRAVPSHGKSPGKQCCVCDNLAGAVAPDWVPSASRALLRLYGWRPVWLRGDFPGLRPRNVARLPHVRSFSVEHPDFICGRRNEQHPAGAGRVLPLGTRGFRRFLGLSMRLVELDGNISVEFCIRRAVDGLSPRLHSRSYRRMEVGWGCARALSPWVLEYPRGSSRRLGCHRSANRSIHSRRVVMHCHPLQIALQPGPAVHSSR